MPLGIAFMKLSLAASTVVALTLTPVMCDMLLSKDKHLMKVGKESFVTRNLKRIYDVMLKKRSSSQASVLGCLCRVCDCRRFCFLRWTWLPCRRLMKGRLQST